MVERIQHYPEHIYDQERIDLARMVVEKELRKLFLGLPEGAWTAVNHSIQGWAKTPTNYHLDEEELRDFWNNFAAFLESIKLKWSFTAWITAENVRWHKAMLPIRQIQMTSALVQLRQVPSLRLRNDLPFAELADVLSGQPDVFEQQKKLVDQHSTDPTQDAYPIIARQAENGLCKAVDGNRRTLKALLHGQKEIEAWVGEIDGNEPRNFWVPLNDMFQLVKVYEEAVEANNEGLQHAVAMVLKARFSASQVAEQAYQRGISSQNEMAQRLLAATQQL